MLSLNHNSYVPQPTVPGQFLTQSLCLKLFINMIYKFKKSLQIFYLYIILQTLLLH